MNYQAGHFQVVVIGAATPGSKPVWLRRGWAAKPPCSPSIWMQWAIAVQSQHRRYGERSPGA